MKRRDTKGVIGLGIKCRYKHRPGRDLVTLHVVQIYNNNNDDNNNSWWTHSETEAAQRDTKVSDVYGIDFITAEELLQMFAHQESLFILNCIR